ncbi:MAG: hypothetical protein IPK74_34255 [Deltaproteobacteria bacterium]|nr:hypothetical protein [Deltaproteobacteria bacterium]
MGRQRGHADAGVAADRSLAERVGDLGALQRGPQLPQEAIETADLVELPEAPVVGIDRPLRHHQDRVLLAGVELLAQLLLGDGLARVGAVAVEVHQHVEPVAFTRTVMARHEHQGAVVGPLGAGVRVRPVAHAQDDGPAEFVRLDAADLGVTRDLGAGASRQPQARCDRSDRDRPREPPASEPPRHRRYARSSPAKRSPR